MGQKHIPLVIKEYMYSDLVKAHTCMVTVSEQFLLSYNLTAKDLRDITAMTLGSIGTIQQENARRRIRLPKPLTARNNKRKSHSDTAPVAIRQSSTTYEEHLSKSGYVAPKKFKLRG